MSHVITVDMVITSLTAFAAACAELGLEFVEGQTRWRWWERHVGDYPLPEGFAVSDLGHCEHAVRFPGIQWEIGLVRRRDGQEGYQPIYDFYGHQGAAMEAIVGKGCKKLEDVYCKHLAIETYEEMGAIDIESTTLEDESILMKVTI